ncbi:MAG: hypothetical protein KA586_05780 [Candidatus Promineofilum sp.]|nr:hypothetical protein [Promineifilum sp.]
MITLNGTIERRFYFPADPLLTLIYFSDLSRVTYLLPHITVVEAFSADKVRIRYQTVELGAYTINIICDLDGRVIVESNEIHIGPLADGATVAREATLNATTGYGYYTSSAKMFPEEGGTAIDYRFQFTAELLRPRGLRMMPKRVVDRIVQSISLGRVEEIAEGFMENAIAAFDAWRADQPHDLIDQWLAARESEPAI